LQFTKKIKLKKERFLFLNKTKFKFFYKILLLNSLFSVKKRQRKNRYLFKKYSFLNLKNRYLSFFQKSIKPFLRLKATQNIFKQTNTWLQPKKHNLYYLRPLLPNKRTLNIQKKDIFFHWKEKKRKKKRKD